jgi:predicted ribonuclease YlaK
MGKKRQKRLPENQLSLVSNFYPKTVKQELLQEYIEDKEVVIATGSSGVGKTYVALATALSLLDRGYKKIILIKSVTPIPGEAIGFIPGSYEEKMEPHLMSYN